MSTLYVETSALARVMLAEPDTPVIREALADWDVLISSRLLAVELRRVARREALGDAAEEPLEDVALVPLDEDVLLLAERIEPRGGATLDALHLATAVTLAQDGDVDAILTYDQRLADGARHHGIDVLSPA